MTDKTNKNHYVDCSNCGPLIDRNVEWDYVRKGGSCLACGGVLREMFDGPDAPDDAPLDSIWRDGTKRYLMTESGWVISGSFEARTEYEKLLREIN